MATTSTVGVVGFFGICSTNAGTWFSGAVDGGESRDFTLKADKAEFKSSCGVKTGEYNFNFIKEINITWTPTSASSSLPSIGDAATVTDATLPYLTGSYYVQEVSSKGIPNGFVKNTVKIATLGL